MEVDTIISVRIGDASFGMPAMTALIRENRRIPHTIAAVSSICFCLSPSFLHQFSESICFFSANRVHS
jgi:hypothetical protein